MSTDMDALVDKLWLRSLRKHPFELSRLEIRRTLELMGDDDKRTLIEREGKWRVVPVTSQQEAAAIEQATQRYEVSGTGIYPAPWAAPQEDTTNG